MNELIDGGDKVVYLYIHKFNYNNKELEDSYKGHPKEKRIYQAIENNGTYRIPLDNTKDQAGLFLTELRNGDNDTPWMSEIEEITDDNISRLEIHKDDFEKVLEWQDIDNVNIKHLVHDGDSTINVEEDENMGADDESDDSYLQDAIKIALEAYKETSNELYLYKSIELLTEEIVRKNGINNNKNSKE